MHSLTCIKKGYSALSLFLANSREGRRSVKEEIKEEIIRILKQDNPGLLPDEAEREAEAILYRKDIYEQAKWNTSRLV